MANKKEMKKKKWKWAVNKAHRGLTILRPSKRLERAGTAANLGSFPYWCLTGLNSSMPLGLSFL